MKFSLFAMRNCPSTWFLRRLYTVMIYLELTGAKLTTAHLKKKPRNYKPIERIRTNVQKEIVQKAGTKRCSQVLVHIHHGTTGRDLLMRTAILRMGMAYGGVCHTDCNRHGGCLLAGV